MCVSLFSSETKRFPRVGMYFYTPFVISLLLLTISDESFYVDFKKKSRKSYDEDIQDLLKRIEHRFE